MSKPTIHDIKEVVNNKWREELLEGLDEVKQAIKEAEIAESMLVMVKLNGNYVRFSSQITDTMPLIAQLELLKYDIMKRMKKED
jgi:glycerol-3-phosphate cytidylyltransferase-like family protein|tara:strand:- start:794 stop:1045 length:252 start_codon:yes stop_codon:yes gene_type:complete